MANRISRRELLQRTTTLGAGLAALGGVWTEGARAQSKSMDQMIGNWSVTLGSGKAICSLTLTNNDAGMDNFQLFLKPRCEQPVSGFAPVMWRLERGELLMQSASGEIWRFQKSVDFSKVAETLGCAGFRVDKPGQLKELLPRAFAMNRPVVIDAVTEENALAPTAWAPGGAGGH